jgi:hypothetical protein
MNQSPTVFLLPDSSVLVTLANSDKLDVLFEPGWTLVLIDSVVHDVVRNTSPCAEILGKWLRRNNLPVVQTRVHERAQKAIRMGLSIPQQMRMQDLGIQEVMNELALDCGGRLGVFLLEEHRFMAASFLEPQNCKKFTLRAFNTFLEQRALSALAARTLDADEAAKQLMADPAEAPVQVESAKDHSKTDSILNQAEHSAEAQPQADKPVADSDKALKPTESADVDPLLNQSLKTEKPFVEEHGEPPLAWLDEKKPLIQRKPSAPAQQAKVGLITGAAIQLLGRKRAQAVEAAFSKLKGTLRLTDSSSKGPQSKKTSPAAISPVARQKPVEPPQGSEEQPVAPPKPMAKLKPHETAQDSNETPRSVTLQKLLEEQAERAKLQPQDKKPTVSKTSTDDKKVEVQEASILPTAPEFPGQAKAAGAAARSADAQVKQQPSSSMETSPEGELSGVETGSKVVAPSKKTGARAVKQSDLQKASKAPKDDSAGIQQTLLSDDDLIGLAQEEKQGLEANKIEDTKKKVVLKESKPAARSKKVATARSGKTKEKELAKLNQRPPSFLLKKDEGNSEAKAPEAKAPEAKAPEAKAPEAKAPEAKEPEAKAPEAKEPESQKDSDASKPIVDPQLVKDFKNLIA